MPFSQRKKMLEKARAKNKKPKSSAGISSIPNITVGTQVRLGTLEDIEDFTQANLLFTLILLYTPLNCCIQWFHTGFQYSVAAFTVSVGKKR